METAAPELNWTVLTNALDYLERGASFVRETPTDPQAWKWVVISLHGALYGFGVGACKGSNDNSVLKENGQLLSFWEILNRCQDPKHMNKLAGLKPLQLTKDQKESIDLLTNKLRNPSEHFKPSYWSIDIRGLPQITINVLEVIQFLAVETRNYAFMTQEQIDFVNKLVQETIEFVTPSI